MNVAREMFEEDRYPDRFPEFKRLMAFCDANNLRMKFFDEPPFIGIVVHDKNDRPIRRYTEYTMHYHTMYKKVYFLDYEDWDDGMNMLANALNVAEEKEDNDLISSLGANIP